MPSAQTEFSIDSIKHSQGRTHAATLNNHKSESEVPYANKPDDLKETLKWSLSAWKRTKGKETMWLHVRNTKYDLSPQVLKLQGPDLSLDAHGGQILMPTERTL